ncbi:MAG: hypothetical protein JEZ07_18025 [Phycisphaerae bacterium]|nr:hypothetical protein [Phycisphaerae bacterium]
MHKSLIFAIIISSLFCVSAWADVLGNGTLEDPYQISSVELLLMIDSNADLLDKHYILTNNLDLTGHEFSKAVIAAESSFTGTFDGCGHEIRNLSIVNQDGTEYLGFFGKIDGSAEVKNLSLVNVNIIADTSYYVGGLCGQMVSGTIGYCSTSGAVKARGFIGGLCGLNGHMGSFLVESINNCWSSCTVTNPLGQSGQYSSIMGGLCGCNRKLIQDCFATGDVINNSIETLGYANDYFYATGGFCGDNTGRIIRSYSTGSVVGKVGIGGFCGSNERPGIGGDYLSGYIEDCYSTGNVSGSELVGGFCGVNGVNYYTGTINDCYSTGAVQGEEMVDGFTGGNSGQMSDCFYDVESSGQLGSAGGMGLTADSIGNPNHFAQASWKIFGFNHNPPEGIVIEPVWQMPADGGWPILLWQSDSSPDDIVVPELYLMDKANAISEIEGCGLAVGDITYQHSYGIEADKVITQSKVSYCRLEAGTYIDLLVSLGTAGDGSEENPYQISLVEDLVKLGQSPEDYDKYFVLVSDVQAAGYRFWQAAIAPDTDNTDGHQGSVFNGCFDGNGFMINGLTFKSGYFGNYIPGDYLGLFGKIGPDGIVKNLHIDNASVSRMSYDSVFSVLAAENEGLIDNCNISGNIFDGGDIAGIACGFNKGVIKNSTSDGMVWCESYSGGFCGGNMGSIEDCSSSAIIRGRRYLGGFCGSNRSSINRCYATGDIFVIYAYYDPEKIGGFCGSNDNEISQCFANGNINCFRAYTVKDIGGFCGKNEEFYSIIENCYATGSLDVQAENIGSFCGNNKSTIKNCYAIGLFKGYYGNEDDQYYWLNGFCGYNRYLRIFENCFWDIDLSERSESYGGIGLSTAQMQNAFSYLGWDFSGDDAIWAMPKGGGYPVLTWQGGELEFFDFGSGTASDPYRISTPEHLEIISGNDSLADKHFILTADIDMAGYVFDQPIFAANKSGSGFNGIAFTGSFNGQGFVISNLFFNIKDEIVECIGLFGFIGQGGVVKNLGLENIVIDSDYYTEIVGGLCGGNDGDIHNCYVTGNISGTNRVGGLCGIDYGFIRDCYFIGEVHGNKYIGGFVATVSFGVIENCYCDISGTAVSDYGGFCPVNVNSGTVTASFWDAEASGIPISAAGIGLTTAQMQTVSTFVDVGWDFDNNYMNSADWYMPTDGYPILMWQAAGCADRPAGDIDGDCLVGYGDLIMMGQSWMTDSTDSCKADLDDDGKVNLEDFGLLVNSWLTCGYESLELCP